MDWVYGIRLRGNYDAIVRDLDPQKYWNLLYQEGVFEFDDMDEVKAEKGRKKQAEMLLAKVQRSGPRNIAVFVKALNTSQPHLFELLQTEVPEERIQRQAASAQPNVENIAEQFTSMHMQPAPYGRKALGPVEQGVDDKLSDQHGNADKEGAVYSERQLSQIVPPSDETPPFITPTDLNKLPVHIRPDSEEVYPMTARPRGIALIINNETFNPSKELTKKELEREKLETRLGSDKDIAALEKLFGALDFKVKTRRDIGREDFLKALDDVSCENHEAYSCFVLCLMSHGEEGLFYCADGQTVPIETIQDFFSNSQCTTLRGKPKLFFIQACRGRQKEKGVVKDSPSSNESETSTVDEEGEQKEDEELTDRGWNFSFQQIIPDHADMLMAYSTVTGYASFRNPREGSRFVRCLVEVFQEKAGYEDVLSMLTMVNERIGNMGEIDSKQVGQPTSTLTKKLFFWPGL